MCRSRLRTILARGDGDILEELPAKDKRDNKDEKVVRKKIRQRIDESVELRCVGLAFWAAMWAACPITPT